MKKRVTPISRSNDAQRRFAWAQPRVLVALMGLTLGGAVWWATAQSAKSPQGRDVVVSAAALKATSQNAKKRRPVSLGDLPKLVRGYGQAVQARKVAAVASAPVGKVSAIGVRRFSLTETDLTPGNVSDERDPQYRPSGDFIAFMSNGVDAVNNETGVATPDGKIDKNATQSRYHIWVMSRNGSGQRQVTGFGADAGRNQSSPSWSPDGNRLVYTDGDSTANQLFIVSPFAQDPSTNRPPIQQLTFFSPAGALRNPAWGASGAIVFASNVVPSPNNSTVPTVSSRYDIFTIDPSGSALTLRRLTGGTSDPVGDLTNDWAPAFSLLNSNVLFFSSNREVSTATNQVIRINGRRIWAMSSSDGSRKRQISNPLAQRGGYQSDFDENPSPSLQLNTSTGFSNERLAFERTRRIDTSDLTRDLNVWSLVVDSAILAPPANVPSAGLTVAGSLSNSINDYKLANGAFLTSATTQNLNNPQDFVYGPDQTGDAYPELYVSNAGRAVGTNTGTVEIYNGVSGQSVQTLVNTKVNNPSGIAIGPDNLIYIASSTAGTIFRFPPSAQNLPFATAPVTSLQGIAFGNDITGDSTSELYAASPTNDQVYVFNGQSGNLIGPFLQTPTPGSRPFDLNFGRDSNADGVGDLYVLNSGTRQIQVYSGGGANPGQLIRTLVSDTNLFSPSRFIFGNDANRDGVADIFISDSGAFLGGNVNRYSGRDGSFLPAAGQFGAVFVNDVRLSGATGLALNPVASGAYRVTTPTSAPIEDSVNLAVLETNLLSSPATLKSAQFTGAIEDKAADREPSFARSSATNQIVSQLVFASQRKAPSAPSNDPANPTPPVVNPGGGPQYDNPQPATATSPLTKFTHDIWATGVEDTTPPILVPQAVGGQLYPALAPGVQAPFTAPRTAEEGLSPGSKVALAFVIQDLESGLRTAVVSFKDADKPKFLTGRGTGPGVVGNDPFNTLGFVPPNSPNGTPGYEDVEDLNADFSVDLAVEDQPAIVSSAKALRIYDDGPISAGGHERQFGAIRGDGSYYCEGSFATIDDAGSPLTGDYYVDLRVTDNAGNPFLYDNIYGFSTRPFSKNNKVLLVSDYTVGQRFPSYLSQGANLDFAPRSNTSARPVESYFLTNPGGTFIDPTDPDDTGPLAQGVGPNNLPLDLDMPRSVDRVLPDVRLGGMADTTTLGTLQLDPVTGQSDYADVWRILCRGPIPLNRLLLYSPQITEQLAPGQDPDGDGIPGPYRQADGTLFPNVTRNAAVASSCVVWASPYTGNVFAGPGTLYDGSTQTDLTSYLNTGARLFVTGQDVAFALSNNGTTTNDFLQNELKANLGGEVTDDQINGTGDTQIVQGDAAEDGVRPSTLRIPFRETETTSDSGIFTGRLFENITNGATFGDAARNQLEMDVIVPTAANANETVTPLYNYGNGGLAAQRIEKIRNGGLQSRTVFFGFGFEAVHRGYRPTKARCLNIRSKIFYNMTRIYFYTGAISGRVVSSATNQPIPNFLVEVLTGVDGNGNGGQQLYVAETNASGEYEVLGLPFGTYAVRPLQYDDNGVVRSANGSFFPGPVYFGPNRGTTATSGSIVVRGGETARDVNFRVQPAPPGSVSGRAISDKGTVAIADDAIPSVDVAVNLPILIRSIKPLKASASFPQGGMYAAITVTDGAGLFSFRNVPSNEVYELILNPRPGFTDDTDPAKRGDIPPNSGIVYPNPDPTASPQVNMNFERRVIPVDPTYGLDFAHASVRSIADATGTLKQGFLVPIGQDLNLGDTPLPPGNGPDPGTGGGGGSTDDFQVGGVYMISIPWMDSSALNSTTTPEKAFTLPPTDTRGTATTVDDVVNYRLTKFDPLTQKYVTLVNGATLTRGEGYFMRPVNQPVSFKRPPSASPARVPLSTGVREFTVTLRRSASLSPTDPNNGFNLIGFPFNPDAVKSVNWTVSRVFVPSTGNSYSTLTAAVSAGVLSGNLQTLTDTTGASYTNTTKMNVLKGYFAKTYIDNVQVTLIGSTNP